MYRFIADLRPYGKRKYKQLSRIRSTRFKEPALTVIILSVVCVSWLAFFGKRKRVMSVFRKSLPWKEVQSVRLSSDDVKAIASEARLSMTDSELSGAVQFINNFLELVDKFKELDLKNVEPFCFAEARECPLREDTPEPFARIPEILGDRAEGAYFKVPRIMEE